MTLWAQAATPRSVHRLEGHSSKLPRFKRYVVLNT